MSLRSALLLSIILALSVPAWAQAPAPTPAPQTPGVEAPEDPGPRTGDTWLDTWMGDVDRYAERYGDAFADELVRYQGAPRALVQDLLADPAWRPSDVYVACAVAQALGRTCREVAAEWRRDHAEGWEAVVERLDAERREDATIRVKRGLVGSYDRWARPIRLDTALRRAFPDRED